MKRLALECGLQMGLHGNLCICYRERHIPEWGALINVAHGNSHAQQLDNPVICLYQGMHCQWIPVMHG